MEKISKVFLFVHPLFEEYVRYEGGDPPIETDSRTYKQGLRQLRPIVKNELHNYGLDINLAAKNPESLVIIVNSRRNPYATELNQNLDRLEQYARKKLGNRLVVLGPTFGNPLKMYIKWPRFRPALNQAIDEARKKISQFEFADSVEIKATGQANELCVNAGKKRVEQILTGLGKHVTSHIGNASKTSWVQRIHVVSALTGKVKPNAAMEEKAQKTDTAPFSRWRKETFGKRKRIGN